MCNGVLLFEDTGELLPDGRIVVPHRPPVFPAAGTGGDREPDSPVSRPSSGGRQGFRARPQHYPGRAARPAGCRPFTTARSRKIPALSEPVSAPPTTVSGAAARVSGVAPTVSPTP
ncbi:hypothetical protein GCM10015536_56890 [Streptomyces griseomycini]|nr:hypothetical protein GCM10015536_56890 [Streptomyces griseomycini]